jgi:hypothetical protein
MEKEFVTYEQALALKELGFNAIPIGGFKQGSIFYFENGKLYYDYLPMYSSSAHKGQIIAPLKQQVFRWFREKYNILHAIVVPIKITASDKEGYRYSWVIIDEQEECIVDDSLLGYSTYEEAENACIDKLIELIKNK